MLAAEEALGEPAKARIWFEIVDGRSLREICMIGLIFLIAGFVWFVAGVFVWALLSEKLQITPVLRWGLTPVFLVIWFFLPVADEILGAAKFNELCTNIPDTQFFGPIELGPGYFFNVDGTPKWSDQRDFSRNFSGSKEWRSKIKSATEYELLSSVPIKIELVRTKIKGPNGKVVLQSTQYISRGGWIRAGKLSQLFGEKSCESPTRWPPDTSWIKFKAGSEK